MPLTPRPTTQPAAHVLRASLRVGLPVSLWSPLIALAQASTPAPAAEGGLRYALGLALIDAPTYTGASGRAQKLRPLWSVRYGRFQLSGARSSGLLGAAATETQSGASADLIDSDRWKLAVGLRVDRGRSAGDDPALAGLPGIRSTLRGRLNLGLDLDHGVGTSLSYAADLLGRAGGGQLGWGLGYRWAPWPRAQAAVGVGATWADRQQMQSQFGVAPAVALRTGRVAFVPGGGLQDLHASATLQLPLPDRWTLVAGLALTQLQGDAAASPLTRRAFGATASLALAWRAR